MLFGNNNLWVLWKSANFDNLLLTPWPNSSYIQYSELDDIRLKHISQAKSVKLRCLNLLQNELQCTWEGLNNFLIYVDMIGRASLRKPMPRCDHGKWYTRCYRECHRNLSLAYLSLNNNHHSVFQFVILKIQASLQSWIRLGANPVRLTSTWGSVWIWPPISWPHWETIQNISRE